MGGRGKEGERGCIPQQQNLSRALGDWDLMHEEGATLSTMCNTHTTHTTRCHSLPNHTTAHLPPTLATLVPTPCTHPPNEVGSCVQGLGTRPTPTPPDMHTRAPPTHHSGALRTGTQLLHFLWHGYANCLHTVVSRLLVPIAICSLHSITRHVINERYSSSLGRA